MVCKPEYLSRMHVSAMRAAEYLNRDDGFYHTDDALFIVFTTYRGERIVTVQIDRLDYDIHGVVNEFGWYRMEYVPMLGGRFVGFGNRLTDTATLDEHLSEQVTP